MLQRYIIKCPTSISKFIQAWVSVRRPNIHPRQTQLPLLHPNHPPTTTAAPRIPGSGSVTFEPKNQISLHLRAILFRSRLRGLVGTSNVIHSTRVKTAPIDIPSTRKKTLPGDLISTKETSRYFYSQIEFGLVNEFLRIELYSTEMLSCCVSVFIDLSDLSTVVWMVGRLCCLGGNHGCIQ